MEASVKKYRKYLVQSKTLPTFVVRDSDDQVAKNIFYTADRRVPVILPFRWSLSRKQKGARLLFVYTQLTFDLKCETAKKLAQVHQVYPMLRLTPVTALNPFYPFLTKKSFFVFNPLHRTSCVLSSRYFVQPCMSLQCDDQNGCMKTVFRNISVRMFAVSNEITMFAMRQTHRTARRSDGITYSADKAGLISGISSGNSRCGFVAELGNSSAYSLYTYQIFRPCDKPRRICSKTYQIRPEHAIAVRKQLNLSYPFLTRKSSIVSNLFQRVRSAISLRCSVSFSVCS